jgi:hypothetical protein
MIEQHDSASMAASQGCSTKDLLASRRRSAILWGIPIALVAIGIILEAARPVLWTIGFLWMGGSCVSNAVHCRRMHCILTGPLFLVVGGLSAANALSLLSLSWKVLGNTALIGTLVAFAPEWFGKKYLR